MLIKNTTNHSIKIWLSSNNFTFMCKSLTCTCLKGDGNSSECDGTAKLPMGQLNKKGVGKDHITTFCKTWA